MEKTLLEHLNYLYERRQGCSNADCFVCRELFLAYKALLEAIERLAVAEDKAELADAIEGAFREHYSPENLRYMRDREII